MKKDRIFLIKILIIYFSIFALSAELIYAVVEFPEIKSTNAVLYIDGEKIYGKSEDEIISVASLTKIMTAIVAIENIADLNDKVIIDSSLYINLLEDNLVVAGLFNNEVVTYYDLLNCILLPSGADAATTIASTISGSEEKFVDLMNSKSQELGMNSTHFMNITGLDEYDHYSTVEDISKALHYAMKNDTLKEIMSKSRYTLSDGKITIYSTISKALTAFGVSKEYIDGGKTGTTEDAGRCLASFSTGEGHTLSLVVTGSNMYSDLPYNILDSEKIYEFVYNNFEEKAIVSKYDLLLKLDTKYCKEDYVEFYSDKEITKYLAEVDEEKIKFEYVGIEELDPSIKTGTTVGKLNIFYNDNLVDSLDIIIEQELQFSLVKWVEGNTIITVVICMAIVLVPVIVILNKKKSNNKLRYNNRRRIEKYK